MFSAPPPRRTVGSRKGSTPPVTALPRPAAFMARSVLDHPNSNGIEGRTRRNLLREDREQAHSQTDATEPTKKRAYVSTEDEYAETISEAASTSGGRRGSQAASSSNARYGAKKPEPDHPTAGPSQPRTSAAPARPRAGSMQSPGLKYATAMGRHPSTSGRPADVDDTIEDIADDSRDTVPDGGDDEEDDMEMAGDSTEASEVDEQDGDGEADDVEMEAIEAPVITRGQKRKSPRRAGDTLSPGEDELAHVGTNGAMRSGKSPYKRVKTSALESSSPLQPPNGINGTSPGSARTRGSSRGTAPVAIIDESELLDSAPRRRLRRSSARQEGDTFASVAHSDTRGVSYRLRAPTASSTSYGEEERLLAELEHERQVQRQHADVSSPAAPPPQPSPWMPVTRAKQDERLKALNNKRAGGASALPPHLMADRRPDRRLSALTNFFTPQRPQIGSYPETAVRPGHSTENEDHRSPGIAPYLTGAMHRTVSTLRSLFAMAFHLVWHGVRVLAWRPYTWLFVLVLLAGLFGASTDNRAARGLWRIPFLRDRPYAAPSIPVESIDHLISRLLKVEQSLQSLQSAHTAQANKRFADNQDYSRRFDQLEQHSRAVDVAKLEKAVTAMKSGLQELTSDVDLDRTKGAALDEKVKVAQTDLRALKDSMAKIIDASRVDKLALRVSEAIEKVLPARLAVSVDPKSGKVDISRAFWDALREEFVDKDRLDDQLRSAIAEPQTAPSTGTMSWSDFLRTNEAEVDRLLDRSIDKRVADGAILSKASFRDLLERDVKTTIRREFQAGVEARINDNVQDIGREILGKVKQDQSGLLSRLETLERGSGRVMRTPKGEDLHSVVEDIVSAALVRHTKDVIARADYALYSSGARVVPTITSPTYEARPADWWRRALAAPFGMGVIRGRPPVVALHQDTSVGACWSFSGTSAQLGVRLSRPIVLDAVVIEHAPAELEVDRRSAPADFEVWGEIIDKQAIARLKRALATHALDSDNETSGVLSSSGPPSPNHIRLAAGRYDASASAQTHIQIFDSLPVARSLDMPVSVVVLKILGLHGNAGPGCLYRFRALGVPADV